MTGDLLTLPLRISIRSAQLMLRVAEEVTGRAFRVAGSVAQTVSPRRAASPPTTERPSPTNGAAPTGEAPAPGEALRSAAPTAPPRPEPPAAPAPPEPGPPAAPPEPPAAASGESAEAAAPMESAEAAPPVEAEAPVHVSEEPELVREEAEPGAEDGAGAQVRVDAPWDGYERASAKEIIARLTDMNPAQLAAVRLYETSHRGRRTVLAAVDRQLKITTGRGQAD
jgi:hypothetical protein